MYPRPGRAGEGVFTLRIVWGAEHDVLHVDPATPAVYEWWYFDALSEDDRWALVAIFFLGSPMSPYYQAVAAGRRADARDWCGVFVSLHERAAGRWRERAYAYNLYRGGAFSSARPEAAVGGSRMESARDGDGGWRWRLDVREPGLWAGRTRAHLEFSCPRAPALPPMGDGAAAHTWALVAPLCRVRGEVTPPGARRALPFHGWGYHDHNFGRLPYGDTDAWYWGRARLRCDDQAARTAVFYHLLAPQGGAQSSLLVFAEDGAPLVVSDAARCAAGEPLSSPYGLRHAARLELEAIAGEQRAAQLVACLPAGGRSFSEGPFYRRLPLVVTAAERQGGRLLWSGRGEGIGEVFRPARLCGPIVSRAMWSRIRRRRAIVRAGDAP